MEPSKMKISQIFLCCAGVIVTVSATAVIDSSLKQRFAGSGGSGDKQNVMVSFTQSIQPVIDQINSMNFPNDVEKRTALTNAQETFTNGAQAPLQGFLNARGVKYESFWIDNKMVIENVDSGLVNSISNVAGVAKIEKEPVIDLTPMRTIEVPDWGSNRTKNDSMAEWGIRKIRADQVWEAFNLTGAGVVVANIDSGVRWTHEALKDNFRKAYGWFDPYLFQSAPYDFNGHGTHTIGTIVGGKGIGVAPNATWIACKGCNALQCRAIGLFRCGQWIQCPFTDNIGLNRNCSMAPQIVSNSWGGGNDDAWYDGVIKSWQTAGIIPVFAIGNSGPRCKTANSPGDRPNLIAVGSTDEDNKISEFSSLGPTKDGRITPTIVAPGGKVRSAWCYSDTSYNIVSGTSMSCPHVSGVITLMKQKNADLTYKQAYDAITSTARTSTVDTSSARTCGNTAPSTYPNNVFGYGIIDAMNSVNAVQASSSTTTPSP